MLLTSSLRRYTSPNEHLHSVARPWEDVLQSLWTTTWCIFSPPYRWIHETGGLEDLFEISQWKCAMHHLMSKPSLSIVGFSLLCLGVGHHLTPFLPLLHVSICMYIVIVQVLFGQPHCYSILVSFSVTSGRLSLTTDFLFQCLLESFTPCLLMCRSYVVGVSIWAAHISYSLYSDQLLFSVKISICCRGKPLWCRVRATFNFVCKEKCRQRFLSHLVL